MPQPKKNEKEQDFINRCTEELITEEDREPSQAAAICHNIWDEHTRKQMEELLVSQHVLDIIKEKK